MEAFYKEFVPVKTAVAVVETGLAGTQRFDLGAGQHHAGNIRAFEEVFMVGFAVRYLQDVFNLYKDIII